VGLLIAPMLLLAACNSPSAADPRIITGRIPGSHPHEDFTGTLTAVEGCVSLDVSDGEVYPVIWPLGFEVQPDKTSIGDVNGTVAIGEELTQSRGYLIDAAEFGALTDRVVLTGLEECNPSSPRYLVLVQVEDFDTPE
jgi:hypothetical protein